uniref:Uncharacterized protein n=1 Tax=Meloidogyne enterolobii TaxID=390850 RepID=A0A6V7U759_MELEN|nr:unnamed protein product [Meloidogyne enterolobii]
MNLKLEPLFSQYLNNQKEFPSFIFHQLLNGLNLILIGTNCGKCFNFLFKNLELVNIYEDGNKRHILAIGLWPLEKEASETIIFINFRGSSISLFKIKFSSNSSIIGLLPLKEFSTEHYGFCRALADLDNKRVFVPDKEDLTNILRVYHKNGFEQILLLSEEFLTKNVAKNKQNDDIFKTMFKGLLMGIELIEDNLILLVFEDSTICVFNLKTKQVIDALKHPKHHQFICWCVLNTKNQTLIFISVIGQIYLISFSSEELRVECVLQKIKNNTNCTALAVTCKNFEENPKIAAGLNNGEIQIFSIIPSNDRLPKWSKQLNICLNNIHSNSIQCLKWIVINEEKEGNDFLVFLCSGSLDEKIAFLQLLNL